MLRKLIMGVVSAAAMISSAYAADIDKNEGGSFKDAPYAPAFPWAGFYLGANVGYTALPALQAEAVDKPAPAGTAGNV
jgi:opacity protein-like surface antigen